MKPTAYQLKQLLGNPGTHAEQQEDGSYRPGTAGTWVNLLNRHLRGDTTVGTYTVNPPDQARTLVFDLDDHEPEEPGWLLDALVGLGLPRNCILLEDSGRRGTHVWVVLADYVSARSLRHLGRTAAALAGVRCEIFPKQDRLDRDQLGSLVKLPGGKHKVSGQWSKLLTPFPTPLPGYAYTKVVEALPPEPETASSGEPPVALECMEKIQKGLGEGNRNMGTFQFLTQLRRASVAEGIVRAAAEAVNARHSPPLSDTELQNAIERSRSAGPICSNLPDELRCSECPVLRAKGLHTKRGQIRHGAERELAVVQLGDWNADGKRRRVFHPDLCDGEVQVS